MIAVSPKLAPAGVPAAIPASGVSRGENTASQPFSAMLVQAKPTLDDAATPPVSTELRQAKSAPDDSQRIEIEAKTIANQGSTHSKPLLATVPLPTSEISQADHTVAPPVSTALEPARTPLGEAAQMQAAASLWSPPNGSLTAGRFGVNIPVDSKITADSKATVASPSRSLDSKTSISQTHAEALVSSLSISPVTINPVTQDKAIVPALTTSSPALPLNEESKDFVADAASSNSVPPALSTELPLALPITVLDAAPASAKVSTPDKPDATVESTVLPSLSKEVVLAPRQQDSYGQNSPEPADAKSTSGESTTGKSSAVASRIPEITPSLSTNPSGVAASGSRPQPASFQTASSVHNVSHAAAEAADANKIQAVIHSEAENILVQLPVSPALSSLGSNSGNVDSDSAQGMQIKPELDKSAASGAQDSFRSPSKNVEVTASPTTDTKKDDSPLSGNSPSTDQGTTGLPLKSADPASSFSVNGIQTSPTAADNKTEALSVPRQAGETLAHQLAQKSTGIAENHGQGESTAYATPLIQSAKLLERMGEAELKLGIRAGEFGSVDIRTSMVRNQFTAEISVERGELGRVMAADLPGLQNRLSEQRVPLANIILQNHAGSHSSASEQQKPREGQPVYAANSRIAREESSMPAWTARETAVPESRLDIHI